MTRLSVLKFVARCLGLRLHLVEPIRLPVFDMAEQAKAVADLHRLLTSIEDEETPLASRLIH